MCSHARGLSVYINPGWTFPNKFSCVIKARFKIVPAWSRLSWVMSSLPISTRMLATTGWFSPPAAGIDFLPVEKKKKYIPPKEDVLKIFNVADPDTQDYLWAMVLTAARMNEINHLTWDDVNFEDRFVTLWTRKKRYGNRESRDVPMVQKLFDILYYRYQNREPDKSWVFWHKYWSRNEKRFVEGPFIERKKIMKTLCKKRWGKIFPISPT